MNVRLGIFLTLSTWLNLAVARSVQEYFEGPRVDDLRALASGFDIDFDESRLVQFFLDDEPVWLTVREKLEAKRHGLSFFDITDSPSPPSGERPRFTYPTPNATRTEAQKIFPLLSTDGLIDNLKTFTSFHTRYYNSDTGKASSEWLLQRAVNYTEELASAELKDQISIKPFIHTWKQTSVIIRFSPVGTTENDPITIIGAHCDSQNYFNVFLRAPGADDDGSGTVTILEAYRGLLAAGYVPKSPLEFHFYAAEEAGLLGSLAIAKDYAEAGKIVKGMLQFDMTAYLKEGTTETIGILTTGADKNLTDFVAQLVDEYLDVPYALTSYPRGGSDHMSWTRAGYQSAQFFESKFEDSNRHIHGVDDRIDISPEFSFDHMLLFSKLAAAFAVELTS